MNVTIIDTGYLTSSRVGSQATRANSGTAMTLKCTAISMRSAGNIDNSPVPASYTNTKTNFASFENDSYTIRFILDKKTSADYLLVRQLILLKETKGLKLLYPSSTSDTLKSIVELAGVKNTGVSSFSGNEVGASIPHLIGRVKDVSLEDNATTGKLSGTITFEETA